MARCIDGPDQHLRDMGAPPSRANTLSWTCRPWPRFRFDHLEPKHDARQAEAPASGIESILEIGAPGRIRTCDLRLRKPSLYPTELRARGKGANHSPARGQPQGRRVNPAAKTAESPGSPSQSPSPPQRVSWLSLLAGATPLYCAPFCHVAFSPVAPIPNCWSRCERRAR